MGEEIVRKALQEKMLKEKLTFADVEKLSGVGRTSVYRFSQNLTKPDRKTLLNLAQWLEIPLDDAVGLVSYIPPKPMAEMFEDIIGADKLLTAGDKKALIELMQGCYFANSEKVEEMTKRFESHT